MFLLTLVALALFVGFIMGAWRNALHLWESYIKKEEFPSGAILPLVPGAMGTVAFAIFPLYPLFEWRWFPLFLDLTCIPSACVMGVVETRKWWMEWRLTGPFVKFRELRHEEPLDFNMVAKLYQNGQVRLLITNTDPRPYWKSKRHFISLSHGGTWIEEGDRLIFKLATLEIRYQRVDASHYVWKESNRANDFDGIDLEAV